MPGESERNSTVYTRMVKKLRSVTSLCPLKRHVALFGKDLERRQSSLFLHLGLSCLPCFPWLCWHLCWKSSFGLPDLSAPPPCRSHTSPCSAYSHEDDAGGWRVTASAWWACPPQVSLPVLVTAPPLFPLDPREVEDALGLCCCFWSPAHCVSPLGCLHLWK